MSDNLKKRGGADRTLIATQQEHELRDWSKKFGVTADQLKEAVQAVGNRADRVEEYLKGREKSAGPSGEGRSGRSSGER